MRASFCSVHWLACRILTVRRRGSDVVQELRREDILGKVLVDVVFQQAVKAAYSSLQLHYEHDRMSHTVHHHGRLASWAERCAGNIDDDTYRRATRAHQLAGRLKHTVSERASRVYSSSCDESVTDELYTCDPWGR